MRLTSEELERLSYIENWRFPNGLSVSHVISGEYFKDFQKDLRDNDESLPPGSPDFGSLPDDVPRARFDKVVELFQIQVDGLRKELTTIYKELGSTDEEIKQLLRKVESYLDPKYLINK